ncbi:MAG: formyltransferase family protein [Hyphomicrobiaceae bacterium]
MRTALLYQAGNFVGREYFAALDESGLRPTVTATVGTISAASTERERSRTGGLWRPQGIPSDAVSDTFESASDPRLGEFLGNMQIDVAIQGGVGILSGQNLTRPRIGWLNVHPGSLPQYRGNSCPEWAILNGDEVVATAHLLDKGIDTGPVICSQAYSIGADWTYHAFRANLYAHCARVLIEALRLIAAEGASAAHSQDEAGACYRKSMPPETLQHIKGLFPLAAKAAPSCR